MKERREDLSAKISSPADPFGEETQRRAMKRRRTSLSIPKQQREKERKQKKEAGKQSARVRAARSGLRRRIVAMVHEQLKPAYRNQPFSTQALDVLRDEYLKVLNGENGEKDNLFCRMLRDDAETDLDALVQSMMPRSFQRIIIKSRPALEKPVLTPDETKVLLHLALEVDISNLSDTDRQILKQVSHETLLKDLKELGIRSRRKQNLLQNRQNNHSNRYLRGAMFLLIHYRLASVRRRRLSIRTAEFFRDQYLKLLRPNLNKSLRVKYMKLIDQIQDGGDEMRRDLYKWTMRTLDQLPAAERKVMSEISCETFLNDLEHTGLIIKLKQKRSG